MWRSSSRLKEQDDLYEYLVRQWEVAPEVRPGVEAVFADMERMIATHVAAGPGAAGTALKRICPTIGEIFLPLDLVRSLREYDAVTAITKRRHVIPTFAEVRRIFNIAVVHSLADNVRLVTLDADDTIYSDGATLTMESPIIPLITKLLRTGCHVSLVTAAGYPGEPHKYEARLAGLMRSFEFALSCGAPPEVMHRFHVMGGECNYLLEPVVTAAEDGLSSRVALREVPGSDWKDGRGQRWSQGDVLRLLDTAQRYMTQLAVELKLDVLVIRKERSVGIVQNPKSAVEAGAVGAYGSSVGHMTYEALEDIALAVQQHLETAGTTIPFCVFNGGHDVFIDVGHKALGIRALQERLRIAPRDTVHVGDRFTRTGNDRRARVVANTLWVASPAETEYLLSQLIDDIRNARAEASHAAGSGGGSAASVSGGIHGRPSAAAVGSSGPGSAVTTPPYSPVDMPPASGVHMMVRQPTVTELFGTPAMSGATADGAALPPPLDLPATSRSISTGRPGAGGDVEASATGVLTAPLTSAESGGGAGAGFTAAGVPSSVTMRLSATDAYRRAMTSAAWDSSGGHIAAEVRPEFRVARAAHHWQSLARRSSGHAAQHGAGSLTAAAAVATAAAAPAPAPAPPASDSKAS